ncbi:MAG TPA: FAD:protein FMN transferase [Patescibacteria group bacterium]|nr:FAD:protein FMN transferase [Patescibacteria group bacterium]
MKQTKTIMGMPITVEIVDEMAQKNFFDLVFNYFRSVDRKFSTYKKNSEISKINRGEISPQDYSLEMKTIFKLSLKTKKDSNGYFDIRHKDLIDPSGLVKGWAIQEAAKILIKKGCRNFYIDAGGDVQVYGRNKEGKEWTVGIKNPLNQKQIVKVLRVSNMGIATSGTYIRGKHIYNPINGLDSDVVSLTVIGPNIYEADRFATAAFAMGRQGIWFIENKKGLEGYMIDKDGIATMTENFTKYVV